eukprot:TRINITY_DN2248_c0_g5_i1.p1 TRINITY_DN2248_c0_g5~~TRINITY_DN2248_c0_g5_i1.p1  ORF type:complete len:1473 (+),score=369.33 TRINITY_DN2248_c0_g5_i1:379-4419(+)
MDVPRMPASVAKVVGALGSCLGETSNRYCRAVEKYPCRLILLYLMLTGIIIGACWRPFVLETDFGAFIKADGNAMRLRDAYMDALSVKKGLYDRRLRRLGAIVRSARRPVDGGDADEAADDIGSDDDEDSQTFSATLNAAKVASHFGLALGAGRPRGQSSLREAVVDGRLSERDAALLQDLGIEDVDDEGLAADLDDIFVEEEEEAGEEDPFGEDADNVAFDGASRNGSAGGRRLASSLFTSRELSIAYVPRGGFGSLDEPVLRNQRDFERELRALPGWRSRCDPGDERRSIGCHPGDTLQAHAWPSQKVDALGNKIAVTFDGTGLDVLQRSVLLAHLSSTSSLQDKDPLRFFPKNYRLPDMASAESEPQPEALRSKFNFKLPLGSSDQGMSRVKERLWEERAKYEEFIISEVFPVLERAKETYENAHIFYSGDVIASYEINSTLFNDLKWALGSIIFVAVYIFIHTGSFMLAGCGLMIIFLAIPVAYVLAPASKTTIASFLSVFLMTGVGSDVIFVFVDFWNDGKELPKLADRVKFMLLNAGNACLATSLTTSVSFFANLASCLQPLREFGLFMGLCVMCAFLLILLMLPPLLVMQERRRERKREAALYRKRSADIDISRGQTGALAVKDKDQELRRPDHTRTKAFLFNFVEWISLCPATICCVTFILVVVFISGVVANVKLDQNVPAIFPPGHNQVQGMATFGKFAEVTRLDARPGIKSTWCDLGVAVGKDKDCSMFWCSDAVSVAAVVAANASDKLTCLAAPARNSSGDVTTACNKWTVRTRLVLPGTESAYPWQSTMMQVGADAANISVSLSRSYALRTISPLALEEWATGSVQMRAVYETSHTAQSGDASVQCVVDSACFLGASVCEASQLAGGGWRYLKGAYEKPRRLSSAVGDSLLPAVLSAESSEAWLRRAVPERRLQVSTRNQVDISVVWGIRPARFTPLVGPPSEAWRYDPTFYVDDPWAQRALFRMCTDVTDDLKVVRDSCWIVQFRDYLRSSKRKFPSRDFDLDLDRYWSSTIKAANYIWVNQDTKKVEASFLHFHVDVSKFSSASYGISYMKLWDSYVEKMNKAAAVTANKAYHTSSLWVRSEAEVAIIGSTTETIIISALCALAGMLVFTRNVWLAFYVLMLVLGVISGLAYFIVGMMGWDIGPIEVISLVVFVGYSVTYALHIAHTYAEISEDNPEMLRAEEVARERKRARLIRSGKASKDLPDDTGGPLELSPRELRVARTRLALLHLGTATASSAVSTLGSSIFLLFCTLSIFVKLGSVVLAVTLLSIAFALITLPAVLILAGPTYESKCVARVSLQCKRLVWALCLRFGLAQQAEADQTEPFVKGGAR